MAQRAKKSYSVKFMARGSRGGAKRSKTAGDDAHKTPVPSPVRSMAASAMSPMPTPASRSRAMAHPESPFSGFAKDLPALECTEKMMHTRASSHPPASPFTAFSSSLPALGASPGGAMTPSASASTWFPPEASSGTKSMLLSPSGWQPISSSKARRSLIGSDDLASLDSNSLIKTPQTPRMQLITFGENSLSEMLLDPATPTIHVGSFGSFGKNSSSKKATPTSVSSALADDVPSTPLADRSRRKMNTRRKLDALDEDTDKRVPLPSGKLWIGGNRGSGASRMFDQDEADRDVEEGEEDGEARRLSMLSSKATPPQAKSSSSSSSSKPAAPKDAQLCKCKKSKCIRQYCICFRAGELCQGCDCVDCYNDGEHEEDRKAAIEHIKISDPLAFGDKVRDGDTPASTSRAAVSKAQINQVHHVRGCKCKNSRCQKKYCECFEYSVSCSAKCGCKDCLNGKPPAADGNGGNNDRKRKAPAMSESRRGEPVHITRGEAALAEAREEKKQALTAPQTPLFSRGSVFSPPKDNAQPSATLSFTNTDWATSPVHTSSMKGVSSPGDLLRELHSAKASPLPQRRSSMSPGASDSRCLLFEDMNSREGFAVAPAVV